MPIARTIKVVLFALLPSRIKIGILRLRGHTIGKGCKIGVSIIDSKSIHMGDYVKIGSMNLIRGLNECHLKTGSKIGEFNWVGGGSLGKIELGRNSSIRRFHYFDASGDIVIGDNTIIAGRGSLFFSHGLSPESLDIKKPIIVGDWCYIGASARFLPGTGIAEGTFVGMSSVVTKYHRAGFVLLAGNPALVKRNIVPSSIYFDREYLRHSSHPAEYTGSQV